MGRFMSREKVKGDLWDVELPLDLSLSDHNVQEAVKGNFSLNEKRHKLLN